MSKNLLVILRHANSLNIVNEWAAGQKINTVLVAMDPIELPGEMENALAQVKAALPKIDVVYMGTKVFNDNATDSRLGEFLAMLKEMGLNGKPVCLTHLHEKGTLDEDALCAIYPHLDFVYDDNLKRDQMAQSGPMVLKAFD
jgi:hypothetical protein